MEGVEIKYGYRSGDVDMYVYTEKRGDIVPSPAEILGEKRFIEVEGYRVVEPELLLLLKMEAARKRPGGLKGLKDRCDVISLFLSGRIDLKKLAKEGRRHGQSNILERVRMVVKMADDEFDYAAGRTLGREEKWKIRRDLARSLFKLKAK